MPSDKLAKLYDKNIIEHNVRPRNNDILSNETNSGHSINPFCGDEVKVQLLVKNGFISKVGFQAIGCKINIAAASLLSETILNKPIKQVSQLEILFTEYLNGKMTETDYYELGDLLKLSQVRNFPIRIKCVLLSWSALDDAIEKNR
tara:strand:- start:234 stop:671 length:438 start_codon:yes stop_codon:yes gene_type:complete